MRNIILSAPTLSHELLAEVFSFPDYYGKNLDALHDCLCEIREDTSVFLTDLAEASGRDWKFVTVLRDTSRNHPHLRIYMASPL